MEAQKTAALTEGSLTDGPMLATEHQTSTVQFVTSILQLTQDHSLFFTGDMLG